MTLTIWTFITVLMGIFSFGVAIGVLIALLGLTWSARIVKNRETNGNEGEE